MNVLKKNPFGQYVFIKAILLFIIGVLSHRRYRGFNELKIEGSQILRDLPDRNVLFVSNHQTYFADVIAMTHVFNASLKGRENSIKNVRYLINPKTNFYYVAAKETMRAGLLPKIFAYCGSVSIERTWREAGKDIKRKVKLSDVSNIGKALEDGWVINFPQGTTTPFKPVRKGTVLLIRKFNPVVVPIVVDGFRRSFDKKGVFIKKKSILQSMVIKEPLKFDYENESNEEIIEKIQYAIEQHPSLLKVLSPEDLKHEEELNKQRVI